MSAAAIIVLPDAYGPAMTICETNVIELFDQGM